MNIKERIKGIRYILGYAKKTDNVNYSKRIEERIENIHKAADTEMWKVKNSPMHIARQGRAWFVLLGLYRLSEEFQTMEEALKDAERMDIDRIVEIARVVTLDSEKQGLTNNKKQK